MWEYAELSWLLGDDGKPAPERVMVLICWSPIEPRRVVQLPQAAPGGWDREIQRLLADDWEPLGAAWHPPFPPVRCFRRRVQGRAQGGQG